MLKNKIFIIFISFIFFLLFILFVLGNISRVGYLSEFKLNINDTLLYNKVDFYIVDDRVFIDNKSFNIDDSNLEYYLLNNKYINNYIYSFRVTYSNKNTLFKNNDIYGVILNTNYIFSNYSFINKLSINELGSPFGILYSSKQLNSNMYIYYKLFLKSYILLYLFILLFLIYLIFNIKKIFSYFYTNFILFSLLFSITLFILNCSLLYPGYYQGFDLWGSVLNYLYDFKSDWHPIIIQLTIGFFDKLNIGMKGFLFLSLFLKYTSLFLIVISLFLRYQNRYSFFIFFIAFIPNIFFDNIILYKDYLSVLFLIFSYSIMFFIIVSNIQNRLLCIVLRIICIFSLIIGMLYRHNFIVNIYPFFILITYDFLKRNKVKNFLLYFFILMLFNAFVLVGIHYIFPRLFVPNPSHGQVYQVLTNHIVGTLVISKDDNFLDDKYYKNGSTFSDLVDAYNKKPYIVYSIIGDVISIDSKDIKNIFVRCIFKHPISYILYISKFSYSLFTKPFIILSSKNIQGIKNIYYILDNYYSSSIKDRTLIYNFIEKNNGIHFSAVRERIYNFFVKILFNIPTIIFIFLSLLIFISTSMIMIFFPTFINRLLILSFSMSFSALSGAIIVSIFSAADDYRFIHPTVVSTVFALISFFVFLYESNILNKLFVLFFNKKNNIEV